MNIKSYTRSLYNVPVACSCRNKNDVAICLSHREKHTYTQRKPHSVTQGTSRPIDDPYLGINIYQCCPLHPLSQVSSAMTSQLPIATVTLDLIIRRKRLTLNNPIISVFPLQGSGKFSGKYQ